MCVFGKDFGMFSGTHGSDAVDCHSLLQKRL